MELNQFLNIPRDKQKQGPNQKIFVHLSRKCFLSHAVEVCHLYAFKRPQQMKSDDRPFYFLAVNHTKLADSSKPWFKAAPMCSNKLNSLKKTMAEKSCLNTENVTNHGVRKRMTKKLKFFQCTGSFRSVLIFLLFCS